MDSDAEWEEEEPGESVSNSEVSDNSLICLFTLVFIDILFLFWLVLTTG